VFIRLHTFPEAPRGTGHWVVGLICTLLLATPAFFFQRLRNPVKTEAPQLETESVAVNSPKRRAA